MVERVSLFKLSGLPDAFGVILLVFSFILCLSPYFSGADFGVFKIPLFTPTAKRWLRILGPVIFILVVLFYLPLWQTTPAQVSNPAAAAEVVPPTPNDIRKLVSDIQQSESQAESLSHFLRFASRHGIRNPLDKFLGITTPDVKADELPPVKVRAKTIGSHAIISVTSYRLFGYIVFLDTQSGVTILGDDKFEHGIKKIQYIDLGGNSSPNAVVEVEYITLLGTGTFGTSVKLYALTGGDVSLSLDKPYYERNSGWGAFKEEYVEFKTKNIYQVNPETLLCEIRTSGAASAQSYEKDDGRKIFKVLKDGAKVVAYRRLPPELFVWNPLFKKFDQKDGRDIAGQGYMTSIYADFAKPTGDWFTKPKEVKDRTFLDDLYDEDLDTEDEE